MQKLWRILAIAAAVVGFLYFIWPTPWAKGVVDGDSVRTNRFNGCTYTMTGSGWVQTDLRAECFSAQERKASAAIKRRREELRPAYEAGKQQIIESLLENAKLNWTSVPNQATVEIYNPTPCAITGLTIGLDGRKYNSEPPPTVIGSRETGEYEFRLFSGTTLNENTEWTLEDVEYMSPREPEGAPYYIDGDPSCLKQE